MRRRSSWFGIRSPLSSRRTAVVKVAGFVLPLAVWCVISYVPFVWHPMMQITSAGDSDFLQEGERLPRADFKTENASLISQGKAPATGFRANPIYLPAPHEVARAFYAAFTTPPQFQDDQWLHQSLWHSATIIFYGFITSAIVGVPLGILCGTFDSVSKVSEPFIDFVRYMPAPAFGALCVAVLGIDDGPKIAIIWIGTFFQMVLVVANTTRQVDVALLEAAQTLGATPRSLIPKVVLPAILPNLYNDMRILIGWAWTYLIVAELIGHSSGISHFIYQQGRYQHFDNVFAGMLMIGIIGLACDQLLAAAAPLLFPWLPRAEGGEWIRATIGAFLFFPQLAISARARRRAEDREEAMVRQLGSQPAKAEHVPAPEVPRPAGVLDASIN